MTLKTNSLRTKILTGVLAGGVLLSTASMAFARTNTNFNKVNPKKINCNVAMNGEKGKNFSGEQFTAKLDTLVTNGTITAEQKTAIEDSLKKFEADRKAEFDKIKSMTKEERQTYMTNLKGQHKSPIQDLIDNKVITQEQGDAIFPAKLHNDKMDKDGVKKEDFSAKLDTLVTNGTITAEQKTTIEDSLKKSLADRKAEFDKIKSMTKEERQTYMTSLKGQHKSPIQDLIDNKIITQEQGDAIAKLSPEKGPKGDHKFKNGTKQNKVDASNTTQNK